MKPKPKKWSGETFDAYALRRGKGVQRYSEDGIPMLWIANLWEDTTPVTVTIKPRAARKRGKR